MKERPVPLLGALTGALIGSIVPVTLMLFKYCRQPPLCDQVMIIFPVVIIFGAFGFFTGYFIQIITQELIKKWKKKKE